MSKEIEELAGYMSERHVWQMFREVSSELRRLHGEGVLCVGVNPMNIYWDELHFRLIDGSCEKCKIEDAYKYEAPECTSGHPCTRSDIWSLGATAFYMYMGCHVFNGRGGKSQSAETPVPFMRKGLKELSETVKRCLSFDPSERPTAEQLCQLSEKQLRDIKTRPRERKAEMKHNGNADAGNGFWPENMT